MFPLICSLIRAKYIVNKLSCGVKMTGLKLPWTISYLIEKLCLDFSAHDVGILSQTKRVGTRKNRDVMAIVRFQLKEVSSKNTS